MKKILVTGSAGFIGYSLIDYISKVSNEYQIYGIDNVNDYYDINLKQNRLKVLKEKYNFDNEKIDLINHKEIYEYINYLKPDYVVHLAAQAGVRYSLENPSSYMNSNILGTFHLLDSIKKLNIKHFLSASTSSVYGFRSQKNKFHESDKCDEQISLYSMSKKATENMGYCYANNFNLNITFFRFFSVYGPWGRPDMALFKFVDAIYNDRPIDIYNNGEMWRDFTYIDDLVKAIFKLIDLPPIIEKKVTPFRVVNIGNQKSVNLNFFIETIEKIMGKKAEKNYLPMQDGDVPYTLSDCSLLKELTNYIPDTSIEYGIKMFYEWYINYFHKKS